MSEPPAGAAGLKRRTVRSALWSAGDLLLRQGTQFAVTLVLARLLTPSEFGVVAIAQACAAVALVIAEAGAGAAFQQRAKVEDADYDTLLCLQAGAGFACAGVLALAATPMAAFFGQPLLALLLPLAGVQVVLASFGLAPSAWLARRLEFRPQMIAGLGGAIVSGALAVVLAWRGHGAWALAWQGVAMAGTTCVLLWIFADRRPRLRWNAASVRALWPFGRFVLAANLSNIVFERFATFLVGRMDGPRLLGFYARAESTQQLASGLGSAVLARVLLPALSRLEGEPIALRRAAAAALRVSMFGNAPLLLGIAALAEPLVLLLFGPQWLECVPLLRILCLAGLWWPMHVLNVHLLMAQGRSDRVLRLELVKKSTGLALLLAGGIAWGVTGVAWCQVAFAALGLAINAHYSAAMLDYGLVAQLRDALPAVAAALAMAIVVFLLSAAWQAPAVLEAPALAAVGVLLYFALAGLLRLRAFDEARFALASIRA